MANFGAKESRARKLTLTQVRELKGFYEQGATQGALAKHYGISIGQIGRIVRGESWIGQAGGAAQSPADREAMLGRLLAVQEQQEKHPDLAEMAKEFQQVLDEPRAAAPQREFVWPGRVNAEEELTQLSASPPEIPLSPLDGGDIPDAVEGAVDVLQDKARAQGVDIDKLLK